MSRPRPRRKRLPAGMPVRLVEFHFEDWHDPAWDADYEPGGLFQHFLARTEWLDARRRWMNGEEWQTGSTPHSMIKSPRLVQRDSAYTPAIPETAPQGASPHPSGPWKES